MLIRLLGLEDEALACESASPFTDVPGWLSPYVAYAYENGLANGISDTLFDPGALCSAQMYVTYVLRALGYSDGAGGDFTYAGAIEFAKDAGIISDALASGEFLRDQMAAVSYLALTAAPKGGDYGSLLEKLIADGAVSQDTAAALLAKLALFDEFSTIGSETAETNMSLNLTLDTDMGALGAMMAAIGMDAAINLDMDMSIITEDEDVLAAISMVMNLMGEEQTMVIYIADGYTYINDGNSKTKVANTAAGEGDDSNAVPGQTGIGAMLDLVDVNQIGYPPLIISDISKSTEGDLTVYTVKIADSFMDSVMGQVIGVAGGMGLEDAGLDGADMTMSITSMKFYADAAGALKKIAMVIDMKMLMDMGGGITMPVNIKMNLIVTVTATGDDVKIVLPDDLDDYVLTSSDSIPLG